MEKMLMQHEEKMGSDPVSSSLKQSSVKPFTKHTHRLDVPSSVSTGYSGAGRLKFESLSVWTHNTAHL